MSKEKTEIERVDDEKKKRRETMMKIQMIGWRFMRVEAD